MIEDIVVERIRNLSLEECCDELEVVAKTVTPTESHKWFRIYRDYVNDRRAYRAVGVEKHYAGRRDGSLDDSAVAKLKLLSFYVWKDGVRK